jgi:prepilin-type N-terminal cleavage/methylation domain-containing protein
MKPTPRPRSFARDQRGFTLVELLVAIALLGLVMAATLMLYASGNDFYLTGVNQTESQQTARIAMMIQEDLQMIGFGVPPTQQPITAASPTSITFWADLRGATTTLAANVATGSSTLNVGATPLFGVGDTIYLMNGAQSESKTVSAVSGGTVTLSSGTTAAYPQAAVVGAARQIVFTSSGNTITRDAGDGLGAQTIATGVQAFALKYFDASDTDITASVGSQLANVRRIEVTITARSTGTAHAGTYTIVSNARPRNL